MSVGGGKHWHLASCLLRVFGPLKMNLEVTLADELNFGLTVLVRQGRSEDEEKSHFFFILLEKMAEGKT